jgi:branched-chain amino acid transport system ATP-binding protein
LETTLLEITDLHTAYGDVKALKGVSLEVKKGEIVTLVGANGAGKSTTLRNVSRMLKYSSGKITFEGEDLGKLAAHEVVARGIVQVPEGRRIFPDMTVLENLRMGSFLPAAKLKREQNLERVFDLFPRLLERAAQAGGTLSGGEQQMLAIGRGLMAGPRLLLLDEPSLGLAPIFVRNIFDIIKTINQQGVTILLIEQNVYQSLHVATRGYVLEVGKVTLAGPGQELLANPHVRKAFLGM